MLDWIFEGIVTWNCTQYRQSTLYRDDGPRHRHLNINLKKDAFIEMCHKAYTALLDKLTLANDHIENLSNRGLSIEEIERLGYKTTPVLGMSRKEKLIARLLQKPKDFSFEETIQLMGYFGYTIVSGGKTGGSRIIFVCTNRTQGLYSRRLIQDFHSAVDEYLEFCAENGKEPQQQYKGSFNVRISPELHRQAMLLAQKKNISLNNLVEQSMESYVHSLANG